MLETTSGVRRREMQRRLLSRAARRTLTARGGVPPGADLPGRAARSRARVPPGERRVRRASSRIATSSASRVVDALPEVVEQGIIAHPRRACCARARRSWAARCRSCSSATPGGALEQRYLDFVYQPLTDADGSRIGIVAHGSDVTDQVLARREVEQVNAQLEQSAAELRASEQRLRELFDQAPVAMAVLTGPEHGTPSPAPATSRRRAVDARCSAAPSPRPFPSSPARGSSR